MLLFSKFKHIFELKSKFNMEYQPSDLESKKFPVSIKGIVKINNTIVLLKNERDEWELPGGKLEVNENPEECLIREIYEELGIQVEIDKIIDTWVYNILGKVDVFIVTYLCVPLNIKKDKLHISHEHKELGVFSSEEIMELNMPQGYKNSINKII